MTVSEAERRMNAQGAADAARVHEVFSGVTRAILNHVTDCDPTHSYKVHIAPGEGNAALSAMGTLVTAGLIEIGEDFQPVLPREQVGAGN